MKAADASDLRQGAKGDISPDGFNQGLQDCDGQQPQQLHIEASSVAGDGVFDRAGSSKGFTAFELIAEQLEQACDSLRVRHERVLELLQLPACLAEGRVLTLCEENRRLREQLILLTSMTSKQDGNRKEIGRDDLMKEPAFEQVVALLATDESQMRPTSSWAPLRPASRGRPGSDVPSPEAGMLEMLPGRPEDPDEVALFYSGSKGSFAQTQDLCASCGKTSTRMDDTKCCSDCVAARESPVSPVSPKYGLLDIWVKKRKKVTMRASKKAQLHRDSNASSASFSAMDSTDTSGELFDAEEEERLTPVAVMMSDGCCRRVIVNPNNVKRTIWDFCSMFLVLYDMVMIPFGFFEPEKTTFFMFTEWLTRMFWSADMAVSFLSGFVTYDGTLEMRPVRIARKYIKSWFGLDVLVVGVDWMEVLMSSAAEGLGFARLGKASRIFRILRLLRLLRLAKIGEIVNLISERLPSEKLVIFIDVCKLIVIMLGVGHLLACIWYAIGKSGPPGKNWVEKFEFNTESLDYQYIMSLRWALSQFAGGMDEVTPVSMSEHLYAGFVYLTAFWSGTVFLSILTSHMTQLYILGNQQTQQLNVMRRYLSTNGISKGLALRVTRNAQHAMKLRQKSTPEHAVGLTELVSEPLRIELHFEMYWGKLGRHPFFEEYFHYSPHIVRKICHVAMSLTSVSMGDILFHAGESSSQMMILKKGLLKYTWGAGNCHSEELQEGNWISEACLWTRWSHRGYLAAIEDSFMFNLSAEKFHSIVGQFELTVFDPSEYAEMFVMRLNRSPEEVSDLPFPEEDCTEKDSRFTMAWGNLTGHNEPKRTSAFTKLSYHHDRKDEPEDDHTQVSEERSDPKEMHLAATPKQEMQTADTANQVESRAFNKDPDMSKAAARNQGAQLVLEPEMQTRNARNQVVLAALDRDPEKQMGAAGSNKVGLKSIDGDQALDRRQAGGGLQHSIAWAGQQASTPGQAQNTPGAVHVGDEPQQGNVIQPFATGKGVSAMDPSILRGVDRCLLQAVDPSITGGSVSEWTGLDEEV